MCGINGIFSLDNKAIDLGLIQQMNQALLHRGPDDQGVFLDSHCGLGQVRLSIIDLSSAGKQPMTSKDGNLVLIFNGEIYNYRAIKSQLDYPFVTKTDSEVLLAAYLKWGKGMLDRLEGMFAFAIYDKRENVLFIARDPLGVKPLYWTQIENTLVFSSEIRGLMASRLFTPTLRRDLLGEYFQMGSIAGTATLLKGVVSLPAGHFMECKSNKITMQSYVSFPTTESKDISYDEAKKEVKKLFFEAVEKRLEADVPFGAFLSGGIDSSAITAVMSQIAPTQVNTFTVSFDESAFSEAKYAQLVADKYKTQHTEIRLKPSVFLDNLQQILNAYDHPGADGANTYIVSKATKEAGITMALSGIGGDELFAGYPVFSSLSPLVNKLRFAPPFPSFIAAALLPVSLHRKYKKASEIILSQRHDVATVYKHLRSILSNKDLEYLQLGKNNWVSERNQESELPFISQLSLMEWERYLGPVLLRDADQMSMAHALEVREPFLDFNLFSYVLTLPNTYKMGKPYPKSLLVDALGSLLPSEIVHRKKMGFVLPWDLWMKRELAPAVIDAIKYGNEMGLFHGKHWEDAYLSFQKGSKAFHWNCFWALLTLTHWMRSHGIK